MLYIQAAGSYWFTYFHADVHAHGEKNHNKYKKYCQYSKEDACIPLGSHGPARKQYSY